MSDDLQLLKKSLEVDTRYTVQFGLTGIYLGIGFLYILLFKPQYLGLYLFVPIILGVTVGLINANFKYKLFRKRPGIYADIKVYLPRDLSTLIKRRTRFEEWYFFVWFFVFFWIAIIPVSITAPSGEAGFISLLFSYGVWFFSYYLFWRYKYISLLIKHFEEKTQC